MGFSYDEWSYFMYIYLTLTVVSLVACLALFKILLMVYKKVKF